jgi:hypothetical protein
MANLMTKRMKEGRELTGGAKSISGSERKEVDN